MARSPHVISNRESHTWYLGVFQRKRDPQGNITKWKARWVLRGDLQDVDFDTYASGVAWSTVRIFLVLSLILQWFIKALDFNNAFVQAAINHDVYAYLPRATIPCCKGLVDTQKVNVRHIRCSQTLV
jgi:hypothetical protein